MGRSAVTERVKWQIVRLYKGKKSERDIAALLNVSQTCVHQTIKYVDSGEVTHSQGAGRPRSTDARTDRRIVAVCKKNIQASANELLTKMDLHVSRSTISRRLNEAGLPSKIAASKPLLTKGNRDARYRCRWALGHRSWTVGKWSTVLFSDESCYHFFSNRVLEFGERHQKSLTRIALFPGCRREEVLSWSGVACLLND